MDHVPLAFQFTYGRRDERGENRDGEEGREWRLPDLLYGDDLVLCDETDMYRRRSLKVNAGKNKVMVLGGEDGMECEVCVDGIRLEHVSEFKYLGCVLDESGTDDAECSRKVASGRTVAGAIRSLVIARSLHLECAKGFA